MLIGYARVSTDDQHLNLQHDALTAAGCEPLIEERASGAKAERTGLANLFNILRAGDTVVIWRLDQGLRIKILAAYKYLTDTSPSIVFGGGYRAGRVA